MPKTIGIVGYGNFGELLAKLAARFFPNTQVKIYSSRQTPNGSIFFSLEEVAKCDWVVLTVSISAFRDMLARIVPLLGQESVIVDVTTVKKYTVDALHELAPGKKYIASHPMFGPESLEKRKGKVDGLRIVICEHTLPQNVFQSIRDAIVGVGFDVVTMSADDHDRHLARTLFLTHFIGQIVARAGFDRTDIDTVSFGFLMDAVESVKHDEALFRDVFKFNPYCLEVLKDFAKAQLGVEELLDQSKKVQ